MSAFEGLRSGVRSIVAERPREDVSAPERTEAIAARPAEVPVPWKAVTLGAVAMWAATRFAYVVFTYFAVTFNSERAGAPPGPVSFPPAQLLVSWDRWDVSWYIHIATQGYDTIQPTAFFPLFPLLIHLLIALIGPSHVLLASMIISNLATLGAFVALGLLAAQEIGEGSWPTSIRALAAYPLAFFTVAGYSDSLFLAFCAFSLLAARRGWWLWAAGGAYFASLSRPLAIVLVAPLLWEYARQHRELWGDFRARVTPQIVVDGVILAAAVPFGLLCWGAYLWARFGDPLIWTKAHSRYWDHQTALPWNTVQFAFHALQGAPAWSFVQARILLDAAPVALFILLTIFVARRLPPAYTLFMLGVIVMLLIEVVPADFDPVNAEGRYLIMAVPVFLLLGRWMSRYPWVDMLVVSMGFLLQGLFTAFWLRGGWIV